LSPRHILENVYNLSMAMLIISSRRRGYKNIVGMKLTHGNHIAIVDIKDKGRIIDNCDGLITNDPEIYLKVSAADCLPIAINDPTTNSVGLVHAGWRGLENGVIKNALSLMETKFKVKSEKLIVFIGPFICQKHYEIKAEVSAKFTNYPQALKNVNGKTYLDLGIVAKKQLTNAGVKTKNIQFDGRCTFEDTTLSSFRRGDDFKRIYFYLRIP